MSPYLTLAMQQNPKVKMIYSAGEDPGLISDVFVVREEFLKDKPGQIVALLKAWDMALADYRKDMAGGRAIIARAVGAKPEELATAFEGCRLLLARREQGRARRQLRQEGHSGSARGSAQGSDPAEGCRPDTGDRQSLRGCGEQIAGSDHAACSSSAGA
jgi:ABC-type nitrate/sulfonate/bicarbonate transport system substrate-binding protein